MESKEFLAYINNPASLDATSLKQIEELQREHPYCHSAQLLYALNLYGEEHPQYQVQLKRASVYAVDRRQLKRHIDRYRLSNPKSKASSKQDLSGRTATLPVPKPLQPVPSPLNPLPAPPKPAPHFPSTTRTIPWAQPDSPTAHPTPSSPVPFPLSTSRIGFRPVVPGSEEQPGEESLKEKLLEIVHKRLKEIAEEHGEYREEGEPASSHERHSDPHGVRVAAPTQDLPVAQRVTFSVESVEPMTKDELIEKFIREEPRISSPRKVYLKPLQPTLRDLQEEEEIVSETLAILYHKQGNTNKSIHIYEKLCLLFPEKSSYFAARIKELAEKQTPGNEQDAF